MKTSIFLIALFTACDIHSQAQIQDIFEQGSEELQEYGGQIAALEFLFSRQHRGYQIINSGLTAISNFSGTEFNLHQDYFSSLTLVNPSIADEPGIKTISLLVGSTTLDLAKAVIYWRHSEYLTPGDFDYATRTSTNFSRKLTAQLSELISLLTNDNLTMTDDQRLAEITRLYLTSRSIVAASHAFIETIDFLILNREN